MFIEKKYSGITVPVVTPVDKNENVDEESYRKVIEHCILGGVHGIFAAGTLGETMALTQSERDRAIRIAADQAKNRVKVFGGVMDTSVRRVVENIKRIEDSGVDAVVITPVFYDRHTSQGEIIRLFEAAAKATKLDILAYNIPSFVIEKIEPSTVVELSGIDNVKGYKDSAAVFNDTVKVLDALAGDPDFSVLSGTPVQYIGSAILGCDGCVPSMASVFPKVFHYAYDVTKAGDTEGMKKANGYILKAGSIYGGAKNGTAAVKYAVSKLGLCRPDVISPADPVSVAEAKVIDERLAACEKLFGKAGLL